MLTINKTWTCRQACNVQNNKVSFGMNDATFIREVLNKTAKGSRKIPDVVDNISFEVDLPTPGKKAALVSAIEKADEWYREALEDLAKAWGLKKN